METAQCAWAALPQAHGCPGHEGGAVVMMAFDAWVGIGHTGPVGEMLAWALGSLWGFLCSSTGRGHVLLHLAECPPPTASLGTSEQVLWVGLVPVRSKKAASSADEWLCGLNLSK